MDIPKTDDCVVVTIPQSKTLLIRLNRPSVFNSMSPERLNPKLRKNLEKILSWYESNDSLWVAIITGTGKGFCSGEDLKSILGNTVPLSEKIKSSKDGFGCISMRMSSKPIIAALNGHALGGGCEIMLNCDIVIAAQGILIGLPEVRRGVVACYGGPSLLAQKCPSLVPYMLAGRFFPQRLYYPNLVAEIVPPEELLLTALTWARHITSMDSLEGVKQAKQAINEYKQNKHTSHL